MITNNFEEFTGEYEFYNINNVILEPNTSPKKQLEKVNNGTATENDNTYGLSVTHDEKIETIHIKYRYLGLPLEETFSICNPCLE